MIKGLSGPSMDTTEHTSFHPATYASLLGDVKERVSGGFLLWLSAVTLLSAGLRLYHLDSASFWVDELNTVHGCANLSEMHKSKVLGYVPTAIGLWLHGADPFQIPGEAPERWRSMGVSEWSSRIGSALIGIVSVPLLGLAGRRLLGPRMAGISVLLLAVAPWHIYWSQASRFYTQQFLFYNLSLIWYFRATRESSPRQMAAALILIVLAALSQPPALVICGVFALDWLWGLIRGHPVRLGLFGWTGAALALTLCGGVLALDVAREPDQWTQFVDDYYQSAWTMTLGTAYMVGPATLLFALLSAYGPVRHGHRLATYLLLAAVVPPVVFAIVSLRSYVGLRYGFVCLYGWLALTAMGAEQVYHALRDRVGRLLACAPLGVVLVSMMLMDYGYYTSGVGFHTRWRDGFDYVARHRKPQDRVTCPHPIIGRYYLQDPAVEEAPKTFDETVALDQTTWIVIEGEDVIRGQVRSWLQDAAELEAVFDVRVVQPYSSLRVYRYVPADD